MSDDNLLKTAGMLSDAWDGKPIKRLRATDGATIIPGKRLAMHIMIQPAAASPFLSDEGLRDQGLLSRILVARPTSIAGSRKYRETAPADDAAIKAYGARLLSILEAKPTMAEGKRNELAPRVLTLSADAKEAWVEFCNHIEDQLGPDGELEQIKDFAAKAAEHAARIAAVLTIVESISEPEIGIEAMVQGIALVDWYIKEAQRVHQAGWTNPVLLRAAALRWLKIGDISRPG